MWRGVQSLLYRTEVAEAFYQLSFVYRGIFLDFCVNISQNDSRKEIKKWQPF